jgi:CHAD domain-containing protein
MDLLSATRVADDDSPARPLEPMEKLGRNATVGEVISAVVSAAAMELAARDVRLRGCRDAEDVHDARVAIRRLRAQLQTLRPVMRPAWADHVNGELKWLGAMLGEVRDPDVILAEFEDQLASLPAVDVPSLRPLVAGLATEREMAASRLAVAFESDRYRALVAQLLAAGAEPALAANDVTAAAQARSVLPGLVATRWKQLREEVRDLDREPSDERLHNVRKRAKKLRYAAETAEVIVGKPARRLARGAERMQDVLGEVHDAVVAEAWLRNAVVAGASAPAAVLEGSTGPGLFGPVITPPVALAVGELVERERQRYWKNRDQWSKVWKRGRKRKLRRWLDA